MQKDYKSSTKPSVTSSKLRRFSASRQEALVKSQQKPREEWKDASDTFREAEGFGEILKEK